MDLRVDTNSLPIVDQFSEEGFVDLVFSIVDLSESEGSFCFQLLASYEGQRVGLAVSVVQGIGPGFDGEMNLIKEHVYRHGIVFRRSGTESDELVRVIAMLYGAAQKPDNMVEVESFTGIALHQGSIDMRNEPVKIKLFGNDDADDLDEDYYESFFNIDLANGLVFWNEKDPEYREPLIRALSK